VNSSFPHDRRTVTRKQASQFGRERESLGEWLGYEDAVEEVRAHPGWARQFADMPDPDGQRGNGRSRRRISPNRERIRQ
jgi:hypothetical protein